MIDNRESYAKPNSIREDNIHGLVVFEDPDGETCIACAQNDAQRVLIVALDGTVRQELFVSTTTVNA